MAHSDQPLVMDVLPWPSGHGFSGTQAWWDYMLSKAEKRRLDNLLGLALLDEDLQRRLVYERDDTLLDAFGLSEETKIWLQAIAANSLHELAQAILAGPESISWVRTATVEAA